MRRTTQDMIQEAIQYGYANYGSELLSNVPKQKPLDNDTLEYQIQKYWQNVKEYSFKDNRSLDEFQDSEIYKNSISFRKIADLHRYGYRQAERLIPDNRSNQNTLYNFLTFWEDFCKKNSAKEMNNHFKGITFKLYKNKEKEIFWTANLISRYPSEIKNFKITEDTKYFSIDDCYLEENY